MTAFEKQLDRYLRDHLAKREAARRDVRAGLLRQIYLINPDAKRAGLDHLGEQQLQKWVEKHVVGDVAVLQGVSRLVDLETAAAEILELQVAFAQVLKAQSETVNRVEDTIEWTYMNTKHAEKDLERAAEIQNGNRYAVAIVLTVFLTIIFVLCGGTSAAPDWVLWASPTAKRDAQFGELPTPLDAQLYEQIFRPDRWQRTALDRGSGGGAAEAQTAAWEEGEEGRQRNSEPEPPAVDVGAVRREGEEKLRGLAQVDASGAERAGPAGGLLDVD